MSPEREIVLCVTIAIGRHKNFLLIIICIVCIKCLQFTKESKSKNNRQKSKIQNIRNKEIVSVRRKKTKKKIK